MLDQLMNMVAQNSGELIVKNEAVPNEHNMSAIESAMKAISEKLKGAAGEGKFEDIFSLMKNNNTPETVSKNPLTGGMVNNFTQDLQKKFGVNPAQAQDIASKLLPQVLAMFGKKTSDPNDKSIDANSILAFLTGGKGSGVNFNDILSKINSNKQVDLGSLTNLFK